MRYNKLGSSDLIVSEIALGCAQFSSQFIKTSKTEADMIAIMHHALDLGITLWDTAPLYGDGYSETVVGKALKGRRDRVVLATKVSQGYTVPEQVWESCEQSLRRLNTDYIDLLQVHWPSAKEENYMTVAAIAKLVKEGKVRAVGVSNFNLAQTEEALCVFPIASNQLPYALVWRYEEPLFEYCGRNKVGVLAYSPLGEGILTGRYDQTTIFPPGDVRNQCVFFKPEVMPHALQVTAAAKQVAEKHNVTPAQVAINWVTRRPHITSAIVGSSSLAQLAQNAAAVDWDMDDEDRALLQAASEAYHASAPRFAHMWDT
ncbi:MAG: aldo/keto reductase [Anaerolineae bacterium]|nr:aldo/keto reductase [Thermoflexales bacterium]MDW8406436.1 aldo/keto reductase [Anaerolineae bacterium]